MPNAAADDIRTDMTAAWIVFWSQMGIGFGLAFHSFLLSFVRFIREPKSKLSAPDEDILPVGDPIKDLAVGDEVCMHVVMA